MSTRQLKTGYFVIEGLNSFATVLYFYYFFFFMQARFGFGNEANLVLAALNGFTYMLGSWWGGRFAQRRGYLLSLKLGFATMILALAAGCWVESSVGQVIVMLIVVLGMCLTWPTLEALISENETRANLSRLVGLYNVIWAGTGAVAYFIGGALLDHLGLQSLFLVPIAVLVAQLALTFGLERAAKSSPLPPAPAAPATLETQASHREIPPTDPTGYDTPLISRGIPHAPAEAKMFLRLAWLSNPFAYIAINTLLAVMPGVAQRLGLSTTLAGFCCSVWCFARVGAFWGLWLWPDWHYRFRWLLASFVLLITAFAVILIVPNLAVVIVAQLLFGGAIGLIYYSSLFYSMDVGETKGEHGGIHEAAIGLGNFAGPALGAATLHYLPQSANSGALAVSALLVCGLCGLVAIRWRRKA